MKVKFVLARGCGADVTFNPRRSILGAISIGQAVAYHLFKIGSNTSPVEDTAQLYRKSKWHPQFHPSNSKFLFLWCNFVPFFFFLLWKKENSFWITIEIENHITTLDFDPNGEVIATIDSFGVCLLSDITTNEYKFHLKVHMNKKQGNFRW